MGTRIFTDLIVKFTSFQKGVIVPTGGRCGRVIVGGGDLLGRADTRQIGPVHVCMVLLLGVLSREE